MKLVQDYHREAEERLDRLDKIVSQRGTIRELSFDAPIKVISEANNRDHWAVKSKRRKAQQQEMDVILLNALRGRKVALPCVVRLTRIAPKILDGDNLQSAFKATRDAIARRIGIDDGDPRIKFEYEQRAIGERSYNVVVEIHSDLTLPGG